MIFKRIALVEIETWTAEDPEQHLPKETRVCIPDDIPDHKVQRYVSNFLLDVYGLRPLSFAVVDIVDTTRIKEVRNVPSYA